MLISPVDPKGSPVKDQQAAGVGILLQIMMLVLSFVLGHVLRRHRVYFLPEASASLLIGIFIFSLSLMFFFPPSNLFLCFLIWNSVQNLLLQYDVLPAIAFFYFFLFLSALHFFPSSLFICVSGLIIGGLANISNTETNIRFNIFLLSISQWRGVSCGRFPIRNQLAKFPHVLLLQGVVQLSRRIFLPFPFASDYIISYALVIYSSNQDFVFVLFVPHFVSLTLLFTQSGFSLSPVSANTPTNASIFPLNWDKLVVVVYHAINLKCCCFVEAFLLKLWGNCDVCYPGNLYILSCYGWSCVKLFFFPFNCKTFVSCTPCFYFDFFII